MGREKGLILNSKFLKYLSSLVFYEDLYIKEDYENCVVFFKKVLEQKLEQKDKIVIEKYFSGFKTNHETRVKFWKEINTTYKREEGNGRIK